MGFNSGFKGLSCHWKQVDELMLGMRCMVVAKGEVTVQ